MKSWIVNLAILGLAYLGFVLATLPAASVLPYVTLPQNVQLSQIKGSVWRGHASTMRVNGILVTDVDWSLRVLPLLLGTLSADVVFGNRQDQQQLFGQGEISTDFSLSSIQLTDVEVGYPAAALSKQMNIPFPMNLDGHLLLNIEQFDQGTPYCQALAGQLIWRKAGLEVMSTEVNLGQLVAELGCKDGQLLLVVTEQNPLGLEVEISVGEQGRVAANGSVKPDATLPNAVHQGVRQFLGAADSQGRYPIRW